MDSIQTRTLHSNYNSIAHYAPVDISTYITENYGGNFETMLSKSVDGYLTDEKLSSLLKSALSGADHTASTGIVRIVSGSGSPNGSISASVGTFYQDTNPRGSLWFKNSGGATNVGWTEVTRSGMIIPENYDVHELSFGLWSVTSPEKASKILNRPESMNALNASIVEILPVFGDYKFIRWTSFSTSGVSSSFIKFQFYKGWSDWAELSYNNTENNFIKEYHHRESLIKNLSKMKGGEIGTSGRSVVSIKFDECGKNFINNIAPLLVKYGLPYSVSVVSGKKSDNSNTTFLVDIEKLAIKSGGEIWNNGESLDNAESVEQKNRTLVDSLEKLKSIMKKTKILNYSLPTDTSIKYGGDLPIISNENIYSSYTGKLLCSNYALFSGNVRGTLYRTLDGVPVNGQRPFIGDKFDLDKIKYIVSEAISIGAGLVIKYSSENIGKDGYITIDELSSILKYIANLRDSDKILVLTASGLSFSKYSSQIRRNIASNIDTINVGTPKTIKYIQDFEGLSGSSQELVFRCRNSTESVTTTIDFIGSGVSSEKTITLPDKDTLRHCFSIPTDCTSIKISADNDIEVIGIFCV